MTIGSSYNYPAQRAAQLAAAQKLHTSGAWGGRYPNPPDLSFDYRRLVEQTGGIAQATAPDHKICIIGAGITGLTAARELYRCGFNNVTVMEAGDRIAGRHYTITDVANQGLATRYAPFEMAAMRMPYFNLAGETPDDGCSLLAYYASEFGLSIQDFPNPGTRWVASTGIYLQEGLVHGGAEPIMQVWVNPDGTTPPPTAQLQAVFDKWKTFEKLMVDKVSETYGSDDWEVMWQAIVETYSRTAFRDFVKAPAIEHWDPENPGNFGGLAMSDEESNIFYSIGFGDGSWGAFYDVCTLYPLRTAIFGFGSQLQLIHGRYDPDGAFNPGPFAEALTLPDAYGRRFEGPRYRGVRTFDDCMLFLPPQGKALSFYEHAMQRQAGFGTQQRVKRIEKRENGIRVHYTVGADTAMAYEDFDSVVVTVPSWILEVDVELQGFSPQQLPQTITRAYKTAHWETSCKVYAPLDPTFFTDPGNKIPQILVTDTFVHDVYAYQYSVGGYETPCILLSYTWEDDATKLASFSDAALVEKCVAELDRILLRSQNIGQPISPYIQTEHARVVRWITEPNSLGCAKLYRAGTYADAMSLLTYNRDTAAHSGLYLAGESFSVDAGWTEPSLRGAIDTIINLCNNTGAHFNGGFNIEDYPHYQV
ncbi:flavin monoamine oxidase family protein [Serratia marcescens]|uniref:flavin monoamine oxidase family protein n=1 Tax=Serratia marcescens TaxID=615 RepID=UPI0021B6C95F|nr:NAD(P)/FAD-dependent oxidoreductase [Serratia marcescens]